MTVRLSRSTGALAQVNSRELHTDLRAVVVTEKVAVCLGPYDSDRTNQHPWSRRAATCKSDLHVGDRKRHRCTALIVGSPVPYGVGNPTKLAVKPAANGSANMQPAQRERRREKATQIAVLGADGFVLGDQRSASESGQCALNADCRGSGRGPGVQS